MTFLCSVTEIPENKRLTVTYCKVQGEVKGGEAGLCTQCYVPIVYVTQCVSNTDGGRFASGLFSDFSLKNGNPADL